MGVLFDPLDEILGNRAKVRLLRALISGEEMGVREAARSAGISHVASLRPLEELVLVGVLERHIAGRQHRYRINEQNALCSAIGKLFTKERQRLHEIFETLKSLLEIEVANVLGAYVIGSAVRGDDKPGSDVDLLVVVQNRGTADSVTEVLIAGALSLRSQFGVRLSAIVVSRRELTDLSDSHDAFLSNAVRDARIITGPRLQDLVNDA